MSTESRNSRARKAAVVVEIGRDWLKIAETGCTGRNVTFSRLHIERIGEDDASLPDCVKTACRELKLVGKRTLLALPRHMVNVRILKLPSTDPDEVAGMVELQMARQTPYSKNEILTDYRVLGVESEGYTRVLLAIAQHGAVRNHVSVLEEAGLDVEQVCLSSEGVHAWVTAEHLAAAWPSSTWTRRSPTCLFPCMGASSSRAVFGWAPSSFRTRRAVRSRNWQPKSNAASTRVAPTAPA
jgi:Tfp pilus assembly PilM family ATPase